MVLIVYSFCNMPIYDNLFMMLPIKTNPLLEKEKKTAEKKKTDNFSTTMKKPDIFPISGFHFFKESDVDCKLNIFLQAPNQINCH